MTDTMLFRKEGPVGHVIFNNPARHNAVSLEMWEAAAAMLADCEKDPEIRVVVVSGAGGKAFVSGADISKFGSERATQEAVATYNAATERLYGTLHAFPKPTIAMIRGYCIGGGFGLAASCDIRIATPQSRFAVPAAKLGLGYDYAGLIRIVGIIGPAFAKEIFFTARQFDAEETRQMGFLNRIVPDAEIEAYVRGYADMIAGNAPLTIAAAKFAVGEALKDESQRDVARARALVRACFDSADYVEGRTAFLEKRKPVFTGS
ncbi:MAG: enoyl-CoA hydratase [Pseudorhodoplanes sp.]